MTEIDRKRLRELCEKAAATSVKTYSYESPCTRAEAEFLDIGISAVPALLDALEAAEARVAELKVESVFAKTDIISDRVDETVALEVALIAARATALEEAAMVAHAIGFRCASDGFTKAKSRTGRDKANAASRCALEIENAIRALAQPKETARDQALKETR